jgi:hypothetical protein
LTASNEVNNSQTDWENMTQGEGGVMGTESTQNSKVSPGLIMTVAVLLIIEAAVGLLIGYAMQASGVSAPMMAAVCTAMIAAFIAAGLVICRKWNND